MNERRFDVAIADAAARLPFDKAEAMEKLKALLRDGSEQPRGKTFGAAMAAKRGG